MRFLHSFPNRIRSGFTLIELLVVIAIISLLAAILFPVFGRARENARRSSCQSNLKQIGLGVMQYLQDYDETYPGSYLNSTTYLDAGATSTGLWMVNTFPYVKSTQIYGCPSGAKGVLGTYGTPTGNLQFPLRYHLGANEFIIVPNGSTTPFKASKVGQSSLLAMLADSTLPTWNRPDRVMNSNDNVNAFDPADTPNLNLARHFEGSNVLYADGHVKYMMGSKIAPNGPVLDHNWGLPFSPTDPRVQ